VGSLSASMRWSAGTSYCRSALETSEIH
jgi:hypothetical protein